MTLIRPDQGIHFDFQEPSLGAGASQVLYDNVDIDSDGTTVGYPTLRTISVVINGGTNVVVVLNWRGPPPLSGLTEIMTVTQSVMTDWTVSFMTLPAPLPGSDLVCTITGTTPDVSILGDGEVLR